MDAYGKCNVERNILVYENDMFSLLAEFHFNKRYFSSKNLILSKRSSFAVSEVAEATQIKQIY